MSGIDEIRSLEKCTYCEEISTSFLIYDKFGHQMGVFNFDEHLIQKYGMVNSALYRNEGLDMFLEQFEHLKCGKCKNKIYDERLVGQTIVSYLEKKEHERNR